jgi:hypothetical protein
MYPTLNKTIMVDSFQPNIQSGELQKYKKIHHLDTNQNLPIILSVKNIFLLMMEAYQSV